MEVPIVDRSPIDMLLSGDYAAREPKPARHRYKIRTDPSVLPLGYWPHRSQEYCTFNQRKKLNIKLTTPNYKEYVPRWLPVPRSMKWWLESALSRFYGETEQRPLHMRVEVTVPRFFLWNWNRALVTVNMALYLINFALFAWHFASMDTQYLILGAVAGFLLGIFLRARQERVFEWSTYGLMFFLSVFVTIGGMGSAPVLYTIPFSHSLLDLFPSIAFIMEKGRWMSITISCLAPFFLDRQALRIRDDTILFFLIFVTLFYSANLCVPTAAFLGLLVKVAPSPFPQDPTLAAAAPPVRTTTTTTTTTTGPIPAGAASSTTAKPKPAAADNRRKVEEETDDYMYSHRWMPPITSPYEGYRPYGSGSRAGSSVISNLTLRASAVASGGGGGGGIGGGGGPGGSNVMDGRRSSSGPVGLASAAPGLLSPSDNRPASGTPLRSTLLAADMDDDGPPPLSSPYLSQGLHSRRNQSQQGGGTPSQYSSSSRASPYQSAYSGSRSSRY